MVKLLLDTTYLLPLFGVKVKLREYDKCFPQLLSHYEAYYSPLSLVEAKWIILKLGKKLKNKDAERVLLKEYRAGLDTLLQDRRINQTIMTNSIIEEIADELLGYGVHDYFDRTIYATACYYKAVLLTEDEELHKLYEKVSNEQMKPKKIMNWSSLLEEIL